MSTKKATRRCVRSLAGFDFQQISHQFEAVQLALQHQIRQSTLIGMLTCNPAPFSDPVPDVGGLLNEMLARVNGEEALKKLEATDYEKKPTHLKRFLARNQHDLEPALAQWSEWVQWRHEILVDQIVPEEIVHDVAEGVLAWRGQNKEKMRCCVITGRALDPQNRQGTYRSFKRYFIKTMEDGLKAVDDEEQDKVCFIYDRRGLDFKHIDPNMFNFCKKVAEEMREWYNERVGVIYILHMNFFFWILYTLLVSPIMGVFSSEFHKKFVLVERPEDLLKYFNEEDLLLSRLEPDAAGSTTVATTDSVDAAAIGVSVADDNTAAPATAAAMMPALAKPAPLPDNMRR